MQNVVLHKDGPLLDFFRICSEASDNILLEKFITLLKSNRSNNKCCCLEKTNVLTEGVTRYQRELSIYNLRWSDFFGRWGGVI
jgi:hypothetical protein